MGEGDKSRILEQVAALEQKLESGTYVIKAGHQVEGISDGSAPVEIPLTPGQEAARRRELNNLNNVLHQGFSNRNNYQ